LISICCCFYNIISIQRDVLHPAVERGRKREKAKKEIKVGVMRISLFVWAYWV